MVEIEGERVLAASCIRKPSEGMKVKAVSDARQDRAQDGVRASDLRPAGARDLARSAIQVLELGRQNGHRRRPLPRAREDAGGRPQPLAMAVNLDACIQCNLCVRACREVQVNDVIGMAGRGHGEKIVFDFDDPMGAVDLRRLRRMRAGLPDRRADAGDAWSTPRTCAPNSPTARCTRVCPYCGVGCQLTYHIKNDKLLYVSGRDGPANQQRLCVKGRFGFDYVSNPQRLTEADGAQGRRAEGAARGDRPGQSVDAFPRGDLGGGARPRRFGPQENPRPRRPAGAWPASARPNARTKKPICSRSWCAPASAPTMSTTARGSATPPRWRRSWKASAPARCRRPSTSARIPTSSS